MATAPTSVSADPALDAHVFWHKFKGQIIGVILLTALAIIGFGAYQLYSNKQNDSAATALASAKTADDFQRVIKDYGSTPAAASAALLLADEQRKAGKLAESNATLQAFIDKHPKHELTGTAGLGIAANLEKMGKTDEALARYRQIAKDEPQSFVAPLALVSQVPLLKTKNQIDEARVAYETVINQYPQSIWAMQAMQDLRTLKAANAPAQDGPGHPPLSPQMGVPPAALRGPAAPPSAAPMPNAPRPPQPSAAPTKK